MLSHVCRGSLASVFVIFVFMTTKAYQLGLVMGLSLFPPESEEDWCQDSPPAYMLILQT